MALDILKKILNKFYRENPTKVVYHFGNKEVVRILGDWVLRERQVINSELFDVENVALVGATLEFEIRPKGNTPPPPPPPQDKIVPPAESSNTNNKSHDTPQRSSL